MSGIFPILVLWRHVMLVVSTALFTGVSDWSVSNTVSSYRSNLSFWS